MPRWRLVGVIVFSFFALVELADLALEFWPGYSGPGAAAELTALNSEARIARLLLLSTFAGGISAASLATVISFFRRGRTARSTSVVAGVLYVGYGFFQIASGLFWITANQTALIAIGALYLVFGPIAIWLGRQATHYRPEF